MFNGLALAMLAAGLIGASPALAADPPAPKAAEADKKICRSAAETGTLIRGHKTCHTKQEWTEIDHANEVQLRSFTDHNAASGRPPG